jgi:hypothetical protein
LGPFSCVVVFPKLVGGGWWRVRGQKTEEDPPTSRNDLLEGRGLAMVVEESETPSNESLKLVGGAFVVKRQVGLKAEEDGKPPTSLNDSLVAR